MSSKLSLTLDISISFSPCGYVSRACLSLPVLFPDLLYKSLSSATSRGFWQLSTWQRELNRTLLSGFLASLRVLFGRALLGCAAQNLSVLMGMVSKWRAGGGEGRTIPLTFWMCSLPGCWPSLGAFQKAAAVIEAYGASCCCTYLLPDAQVALCCSWTPVPRRKPNREGNVKNKGAFKT